MAKVLKRFDNPSKIYGLDTFTGFPKPKNTLDIFYDPKYEYTNYDTVSKYCSPYNIELIRGDIVQTCSVLEGIDLSFVFFDTDNYTATKAGLETCIPQIIEGGMLAFDHYYSPNWIQTIGEKIAINKELLINNDFINLHGTGIFIKTK